jgi:hypothetical protein
LFQNLSPIVGEEAVGQMLAHFPISDGEKPVTKDNLDASMSELRAEMSQLRVELHQEISRLLIWVPTSVAAICTVIAFITRLTI